MFGKLAPVDAVKWLATDLYRISATALCLTNKPPTESPAHVYDTAI